MNIKLIFQLSLFGLSMALATVFFIHSNIEPIFWLAIFIVCAYFIAKKTNGKYFFYGFLVSLVNCMWITSAHIIFFQTYIFNHPGEANTLLKIPMPDSRKLMMLVSGIIIGIISGIVLGLFAFIASKIFKKKQVLHSPMH
jgi:uncharacterized protein YneF (UPF0154 family)